MENTPFTPESSSINLIKKTKMSAILCLYIFIWGTLAYIWGFQKSSGIIGNISIFLLARKFDTFMTFIYNFGA